MMTNWSMDWGPRRERFRKLIHGSDCHFPISVFDPLTARMAVDLGFEMGMLAGSVSALAVLGAPDKILITATEFADLAHRICRAADISLIVDADHGYGNALNVERSIALLDHAGICAATLEDTNLPQPFGVQGQRLLPIEEGVGKMKAAMAGKSDPNFTVIARTSAIMTDGRDECLRRVQAYDAAGVDAIALIGVREEEDLEILSAATDKPIFLGGWPANKRDPAYLAAQGVRMCLTGHQPFMAAMQAAYETMQQWKDDLNPQNTPKTISDDLLKQLTRDADIAATGTSFLNT